MAYSNHGDSFTRLKSAFNPRNYVRDFPLDLQLVLLVEFATVLLVGVSLPYGHVLRYAFAFLLVMYVPGYALMAAVFPGKDALTGLERIVLSFTASLAAVPAIGYVLNFTRWGVRLEPMLIAIVVLTTFSALYANKRRNDLPPDERHITDLKGLLAGAAGYVFPRSRSFADRALNVLIVLSLLALLAAATYSQFAPGSKESYTELYVLNADGKTGDYPMDFYLGYAQPVTAYVANHELADMSYGLYAYLDDGQNHYPLFQEQFTLGQNQTWERRIDLRPEIVGDHQKIVFDLVADGYGNAPYRSVYLWVNVSPSGETYTDLNVYGYNRSIPVSASIWNLTQTKNFDVWVTNHEFRRMPYYFEVTLDEGANRTVLYNQSVILGHNQTWNKYLALRPDHAGSNMTLAFNLYADGNMSVPYRSLALTTNVTAPQVQVTPGHRSTPE